MSDQADETLIRSERLLALRDSYQTRVREKRASALLGRIVDHLFSEPAVTVAHVAELTETKPQSAARMVSKLVEHGILREATGRKSYRLFLADEILRTTEDPIGPPA